MSAPAASSRFALRRLCAIACAVAVVALAACTTPPAPPPPPPVPVQPPAPHQLSADQPEFFKLPNQAPDKTLVRVGIILPFSSASATTRALAQSMMKAAELALYDSGNRDILLMVADETGSPAPLPSGDAPSPSPIPTYHENVPTPAGNFTVAR